MRNARRTPSYGRAVHGHQRHREWRRPRLTIEKLAEGQDYLDARELRRAGALSEHWRTLPLWVRWPVSQGFGQLVTW
jgi:hypothetical protein